ncbi:protein trichome birefringence-like 6 [Mercurialis annua]|uniref:protein trichome birefringence-like 6 n=1 Tax=Mercurialis annua TaxID=3986 RepID=UPI00215EF3F4|nr:protein trichome birefringence-like 6 [Mercurialis annua]
MDRQRSFSVKSTKFLVFSFTLSSSIIFLVIFTIWVFKSSPSVFEDARFELNGTSFVLGLKPISVQSFTTNFSSNSLKDSNLTHTHFSKPENTSGFASISISRNKVESEILKAEGDKNGGIGNFTAVQGSVIVPEEKKINANSTRKIEVSVANIKAKNGGKIKEKRIIDCDFTKGKWVYDEGYPLYTNKSCPFIDEGFDCVGNGRLDKDYMKWRWQPQDCDIPRFNGSKMLELMRGKRLVFVGDSINRNQWESMLCMLFGAVRDPKKVYETHGRKITKEKGNYSFKFVDYKCTVEYYVSHYLVHEGKARVGQKRVQTLRIDAIDRGSSRWKGADFLIFNSAHWWSHSKTKSGINYYQEGNLVHPKLDVSTAFRRALTTWASWVDRHVNPRKTQVFFRSSSPSHFRGGQWNSGGHCREATQPLNETYYGVAIPEKNTIMEDVIKRMKTPVRFFNVTSLSEFRIDGHPSIYGKTSIKRYTSSGQDCSHWCLPGVPDTWNELLYSYLQNRQRDSIQ